MYKYLNVHPKEKLVNDCVKRAFTIALDKEYKQVAKELNTLKRELGAKRFNNDRVWKEYTKRKGMKKLSFPAQKGKKRMNGHTFTKQYPEGVYILNMAKHLSVCKNGIIYDTWDCRNKCVYTAFKLENLN